MKVLWIDGCVREESRTKKLTQDFLANVDIELEVVELENERIEALNRDTLNQRQLWCDQKDFQHDLFKYAKQFKEADLIVMSCPYWDLSFPSMIKNYIEQITVNGLTFYYDEKGFPQSLCKAKKLIYITTAGGPIISHQEGYGYIELVSKAFYGINEFYYVYAENLDVIGSDVDGILNEASNKLKEYKTTFFKE